MKKIQFTDPYMIGADYYSVNVYIITDGEAVQRRIYGSPKTTFADVNLTDHTASLTIGTTTLGTDFFTADEFWSEEQQFSTATDLVQYFMAKIYGEE